MLKLTVVNPMLGALHVLFALLWTSASALDLLQPCDSHIYCQGKLLETIQLANIYTDSKTFVDLKQKNQPDETLRQFEEFMEQTGGSPTRDQVFDFVNATFEQGNELENWEPSDWIPKPALLHRINSSEFRIWASDINGLWKNLSRKMHEDVQKNSDQYSIIYVPNGFIVPGGRFREFYYWDTYWIVRGLLLSEMYTTVKGMLENFLYMVKEYGLVPNGGRVYYLRRSQPPMLTPMAWNYVKATNDTDFLRTNIAMLEEELQFFLTKRTVEVTKNDRTYTLARYYALSDGPRPESYSEDYHTAERLSGEEAKQTMYVNLKSAAESGWDFSSRWFIKDGTNQGNLSDIQTQYIIPVDLNAILYWNIKLMSQFYTLLGNVAKAEKYARLAFSWKTAVTEVLWDEEVGVWLDYDMLNNINRNYFYPSNMAPLWTGCYDEARTDIIAEKVVAYMEEYRIAEFYKGGIPTSREKTNEQWDLPNAWPPLQAIVIQGLEQTRNRQAQDLAYRLATNWVRANYKGYQDAQEMYEKYDAEIPGKYGGGGEYQVQSGFGWTNGVILELLDQYGQTMTPTDRSRLYTKWPVPRRHHA